jgi:type IV secretion system protein TrbL
MSKLQERAAVGRPAWLGVIALTALVLAALPLTAYAFSLPFFDPASTVAGNYPNWATIAQGYARNIYLFLLVFEIIAIAITTLLFRENLGEFFASVGFKILLGSVFFWFIANGPDLAMKVKEWFTGAGTTFGGMDATIPVSGFLLAASMYFASADLANGVQSFWTTLWSTPPLCVFGGYPTWCPVGNIANAASTHSAFILISQGLGLMLALAAVAILLQFYIVTIESYLVMSVGIIMIGFAGSRWTFPFSQGYFSYMIGVGVKLMVTYIVLGVAGNALVPTLASAEAGLLAAAALPYGASDATAIGIAAIGAVYVVLTAGMVWTIPAFTAALMSGQSQSSGSAVLQQAMSSMAGSAQMFAQLNAAKRQDHDSQNARGHERDMAARANGAVASNGPLPSGDSPRHEIIPPPGAGSGNISTGGSASNFGAIPINPRTGMPYGAADGGPQNDSGRSLAGMSKQQLQNTSTAEFNERLANTNLKDLNHQDWVNIAETHRADAQKALGDRADRAAEGAALNLAYGLGGLAQAAPRDIGQPAAVQVRLSNPDKL